MARMEIFNELDINSEDEYIQMMAVFHRRLVNHMNNTIDWIECDEFPSHYYHVIRKSFATIHSLFHNPIDEIFSNNTQKSLGKEISKLEQIRDNINNYFVSLPPNISAFKECIEVVVGGLRLLWVDENRVNVTPFDFMIYFVKQLDVDVERFCPGIISGMDERWHDYYKIKERIIENLSIVVKFGDQDKLLADKDFTPKAIYTMLPIAKIMNHIQNVILTMDHSEYPEERATLWMTRFRLNYLIWVMNNID